MSATKQTAYDVHSPVAVALDLGWEMADLYSTATVRAQTPSPPADLPTLSDLNAWQRTELAIAHIEAALHWLTSAITGAGLSVPSLSPVQSDFAGGSEDALRSAICDFHWKLFTVLHGADANLGKAYDLGRSMAYTCRRPQDASSLRDEFRPARLDVLKGWLADLATALPDHASRAVAISIGIWEEAIPEPQAEPKSWQIHDNQEGETRLQLHRQAKMWRAVLTGAKDGRDMLQAGDYMSAAGRLFATAARLLGRFIAQTYFIVPIVLGGAGVGVFVILTSHGKTAANIVGAITAAAAALGITWKGTQSTLMKLAGELEQPLWNAELDNAISEAITTLDLRTGPLRARQLRAGKISKQIARPAGPRLIEPPPATS